MSKKTSEILGVDLDPFRERLMAATVAVADEVGVRPIVDALGLSRSTFYRHRGGRPKALPRPTPSRALSEEENERILSVLHSDAFLDVAPAEMVATLSSRGQYLCSTRRCIE